MIELGEKEPTLEEQKNTVVKGRLRMLNLKV